MKKVSIKILCTLTFLLALNVLLEGRPTFTFRTYPEHNAVKDNIIYMNSSQIEIIINIQDDNYIKLDYDKNIIVKINGNQKTYYMQRLSASNGMSNKIKIKLGDVVEITVFNIKGEKGTTKLTTSEKDTVAPIALIYFVPENKKSNENKNLIKNNNYKELFNDEKTRFVMAKIIFMDNISTAINVESFTFLSFITIYGGGDPIGVKYWKGMNKQGLNIKRIDLKPISMSKKGVLISDLIEYSADALWPPKVYYECKDLSGNKAKLEIIQNEYQLKELITSYKKKYGEDVAARIEKLFH